MPVATPTSSLEATVPGAKPRTSSVEDEAPHWTWAPKERTTFARTHSPARARCTHALTGTPPDPPLQERHHFQDVANSFSSRQGITQEDFLKSQQPSSSLRSKLFCRKTVTGLMAKTFPHVWLERVLVSRSVHKNHTSEVTPSQSHLHCQVCCAQR